jgi:Ulp1 family protease
LKDETTWLNDGVINFYIELLSKKNNKIYSVSSWLMAKLILDRIDNYNYSLVEIDKYNYSLVESWLKAKKDLDKICYLHTYDMLFIPVNIGNTHWIFSYIDLQTKKIYCLDSLNDYKKSNQLVLTSLKKWIIDYSKHIIERIKNNDNKSYYELVDIYTEWSEANWEEIKLNNIPKQQDGCSCGIFCLLYAYCIANKIQLSSDSFSRLQLYNNIRSTIAQSIVVNKVLKLPLLE